MWDNISSYHCAHFRFHHSLKKLFIGVTSDREFSRTRLMISLLAPLIVLTLLPLIVCIWYESQILIYILLYNALASGGDILSFITLASNKGSRFIINGDKLYTQDQFWTSSFWICAVSVFTGIAYAVGKILNLILSNLHKKNVWKTL